MALQFPVADIMGNIDRGRNFAQAERMRPINEESARLGVEQQQQALTTGGLQQQNIQSQMDQRTNEQKSQALYRTAFESERIPDDQLVSFFDKKIAETKAIGGNTAESEEGRRRAMAGDFESIRTGVKNILETGYSQGDIERPNQGAGDKFFAPQTDQDTGQRFVTKVNPNTGVGERIDIEGAFQPTNAETMEAKAAAAQTSANLEIGTAKTIATNKARVGRTSVMKQEYSKARKLAARSNRRVLSTQKLVDQASQGLGGTAKLQLSRVFPNIDASNEGALSSAFKSLSMDELAKFSGPTTDFEFEVTEDIVGSLGQGVFANQARLASLERNNWFVNRESEQFDKHVNAGHDPDQFAFNIDEMITPKKGGKSYSIQDTAVANHVNIDEVIKKLKNANN